MCVDGSFSPNNNNNEEKKFNYKKKQEKSTKSQIDCTPFYNNLHNSLDYWIVCAFEWTGTLTHSPKKFLFFCLSSSSFNFVGLDLMMMTQLNSSVYYFLWLFCRSFTIPMRVRWLLVRVELWCNNNLFSFVERVLVFVCVFVCIVYRVRSSDFFRWKNCSKCVIYVTFFRKICKRNI